MIKPNDLTSFALLFITGYKLYRERDKIPILPPHHHRVQHIFYGNTYNFTHIQK
ncbi:hypothetical protein FM120_31450 [Sphingobacterium faecium PCAi_F2.5]|nr:hypothetical protein FM120_31450 [Sphingobacterium faecium PCAi_F2.5]